MEEDDEVWDKADREYIWHRKCEIFNNIENLWLDYLEILDYPNVNFVEYVCQHHDPPLTINAAEYQIWIWKFVRSFSPMHLN